MQRRLGWFAFFSTAILATALYWLGHVQASPAANFTSKTLYKGTFADIDVLNYFLPPEAREDRDEQRESNLWVSLQKTKGPSDMYIQQNIWAKKDKETNTVASTGWHTHPGHSLVIVTEGTLTAYEGHDPECKPHVYTKGMTFVDAGGDHVHIVRNETDAEAQTIAVQFIPSGADRRVDAPDPGNCHF